MNIDIRHTIAKRVAKLLKNGQVVNLGIGIPTLVPDYIEEDQNVIFQSENGIIGVGPKADESNIDLDYIDAGANLITIKPGTSFLDSSTSFGFVRSGRIDVTVLGALQADEKGNLANWAIPDKIVMGYGGAMDLVSGVPIVILAMEHTVKGKPKIMKNCNYPLTGANCVKYIVTEFGLMEITDKGIVLKELTEGTTVEMIQNVTEAKLIIPDEIGIMEVIYE